MVNPDIIFGRLSNRLFQMAALYAYCRDNNYPIFVQDEKYFAKYADEVRQLFGDGIVPGSIDRVAIHVRRAKNPINPLEPAYSDNPFYENLSHHLHEDMSDNYYVRAMKHFPDEKFLIFSDDIQWCKQSPLFQGDQFEFSDGKSDIEDLNGMASCKHIIGANSSMSWWGAFLGEYPGRKIIFPKKWFSNPEHERFIGIPERWERI